jgi:hypothetical protein
LNGASLDDCSLDGIERGAHRAMRAVKAGSGGHGRDAERVGNLAGCEAEVVMHREDCALVGRKTAEASLEQVSVIY